MPQSDVKAREIYNRESTTHRQIMPIMMCEINPRASVRFFIYYTQIFKTITQSSFLFMFVYAQRTL